ncbi:MAG TPA: mechanosensitive ion channel domain-containing protein [Allosphingosinicella sp.]|nr:mechanosensitive ion channel domain-containing protein [Allosphingosinicella sp.]
MTDLAAELGLALPEARDMVRVGAALVVIFLTVVAGWLAGRWGGPLLADFWVRRIGARAEEITPRMSVLLRYLVIWLTVSLALRLSDWTPLAAFLLGLVAAAAAALFVLNLLRGLHSSRAISGVIALFLFVAILAGAVGGLAGIERALDSVAFTIGSRRLSLLNLVQLLVVLFAIYAVVRLTIKLVSQSIRSAGGLDPTQQLLAQKLAAIAIIAIAFFVAIDLAGIDLTALAVFSGALGLAIGFGLQKTFGNLIAGIILLMDRSIKPGDVIAVGESFGSVSKIGVRAVSIVTRDGKEYLIPNEILMTEEVVNWSYSTRDVRISIPVGIAYDCDVALAQTLMIEAATAAKRVLETPAPVVWMTAFGESSIDHEIRVWIRDPEAGIGSVRSEILNKLWALFKEHRIHVPYPQRDIRLKEWPADSAVSPAAPPARRGRGRSD